MSDLCLSFRFIIGEEVCRLGISIVLLIIEVRIGEDGRKKGITIIDDREGNFIADEDNTSHGRGLSLESVMVDIFEHLGDISCFDSLCVEREYHRFRIREASLDITLCISIDVGSECVVCIEIFIDQDDDEICIRISRIGKRIGSQ